MKKMMWIIIGIIAMSVLVSSIYIGNSKIVLSELDVNIFTALSGDEREAELPLQSEELGVTNEYTASTETTCNGGICNKVLYSGIRFVEEDGKWKKVENAKSLKDVWKKEYIEKDPAFDINIISVNYTDYELEFIFNSTYYPFLRECDSSKINDIKCDFKFTLKEEIWNDLTNEFDKVDTKFQYKYQEKDGIKSDMKFVQKGNALGKEFKFGGNSTIIQLEEPNTEVLNDDDTTYTTGTSQQMYIDDFYDYSCIAYVQFNNISNIPEGQQIDNALLHLYYGWSTSRDGDEFLGVYGITNYTWTEEIGAGEMYINQGLNFLNKSTSEIGYGGVSFDLDVTSWIQTEYELSRTNVTFGFALLDDDSDDEWGYFGTKEAVTTLPRPYLNITYSEPPADLVSPVYSLFVKNISDESIYTNSAIQFNITITDADNNVHNWTFNWNESGVWNNATNSTTLDVSAIKAIANVSMGTRAEGYTIGYQFCAADDQIPSNMACDALRTFSITAIPTDTCTYSGSGDWTVNCADACYIDTAVSVVPSNLIFYGVGSFTVEGVLITAKNVTLTQGCPLILDHGGNIIYTKN